MNSLWKSLWFCSADVAWIFWIGGITFYIAIVVPVGGEILGPDLQGEVTQVVTWYMNLAGFVAILAHAIPSCLQPHPKLRLPLFSLLAIQFSLAWLRHELVLHRLNPNSSHFPDWNFYTLHRVYLWLTTLQWLGAVLLTCYSLFRRRHWPSSTPASP